MKETLTNNDYNIMRDVRCKWIDRALLNTQQLNKDVAQQLVNFMYRLIGRESPVLVCVDSPMAAQVAANLLSDQVSDQVSDPVGREVSGQVRSQVSDQVSGPVSDQVGSQVGRKVWLQVGREVSDQVGDQVRAQVSGQVGREVSDQVSGPVSDQVGSQVGRKVWLQVGREVWLQVGDQVRAQVSGQVGREVSDKVWSQVRDQVWSQVGRKVWLQVGREVWSQVWRQVWSQVRAQVSGQVGRKVRSQVRDQVEDQVGREVRDQVWRQHYETVGRGLSLCAGWLACYDAFEEMGIDVTDAYRQYRDMVYHSNVWDLICLDRVAIVYPPPQSIHRDASNRLHCDQEAAAAWADGYCQYWLKGVAFEELEWRKIISEKYTLDDLAREDNAERRSVALSMLKPSLLLEHVGAIHVDTGEKGTELYCVPDFQGSRETEFCMLMTCPSTGRQYLEWVEPAIGKQHNADLAQASAWRDDQGETLTVEEYLDMFEA